MTKVIFVSLAAAALSLMSLPALAQTEGPATRQPVMQVAQMEKDIVVTATQAGKFKTLVTALKAAGLVATLKGPGPFTVFAPTDAAFAKVPPAALKALLKDKKKLTAVLTFHVVPGKLMAKEVLAGAPLKTVEGQTLKAMSMGGTAMVNNAKIITTDIKCSNGVIHVIDTVLMPK